MIGARDCGSPIAYCSMVRRTRAFTFGEMLVVIAICATLAAILLPVFARAQQTARRSVCASNLHQIHSGTMLYIGDYDDRMMPIAYQPQMDATSRNDRTWVQLVLPYVPSFKTFECPSDTSLRVEPSSSFDQDLVPGDTYSKYYTASKQVDYGYNFQYLAPVEIYGQVTISNPKIATDVASPSSTLLFVESVNDRADDGSPIDGGSWLVVPPCRYMVDPATRRALDTFVNKPAKSTEVYTTSKGWELNNRDSGQVYGGAWPWHEGRSNVTLFDGSIRSMTPRQLSVGCDARPDWSGFIDPSSTYLWDLR